MVASWKSIEGARLIISSVPLQISIIANENLCLELNLKIYNFLPFGISFAALASRHSINVLSTEVDALRALKA
jgi:hypothetical protein